MSEGQGLDRDKYRKRRMHDRVNRQKLRRSRRDRDKYFKNGSQRKQGKPKKEERDSR